MNAITAVKGFKDILPEEAYHWQQVEQLIRGVLADFCFKEIHVPILEKTELFAKGIGDTTDIVEKEMYTFRDRGEDSLTLRPEATASVLRAYIEHSMFNQGSVTKLFSIGPMFRRERPQKGRYRQFHQIDVEVLGSEEPQTDAELILMLVHLFRTVGLENLSLDINSLGCPACRSGFRQKLIDFMQDTLTSLCEDCQRRLTNNPLRVFDCKNDACRRLIQDAPTIPDFICDGCRWHFDEVKACLDMFALPYNLNPRMVRGLDYYTRTTFEITIPHMGAQNAVVGGGRYDGLIRDLGGPDIPGIGFAIGFERLMSLLHDRQDDPPPPVLFIAALGSEAQAAAFKLCNQLRLEGIRVEMDYSGKSLKSQMKKADKSGSLYTLILGEREIQAGEGELRDMRSSKQWAVPLESLRSHIAQ